MSNSKKRAYKSEGRQAQAALTKQRILEEAKKLFHENGVDAVTIEVIAQASEVSTPTIYALFQSKRGLLRALIDNALEKDKYEEWVSELSQEQSLNKRLLLAAKISRHMYDAEKVLMEIIRGASLVSPELKELEQEREKRRFDRQKATMKEMAIKKRFKKGLTLSKASDILWALTGRDLYRQLVMERGWSSEAYEAWLGELLIQALTSEK